MGFSDHKESSGGLNFREKKEPEPRDVGLPEMEEKKRVQKKISIILSPGEKWKCLGQCEKGKRNKKRSQTSSSAEQWVRA